MNSRRTGKPSTDNRYWHSFRRFLNISLLLCFSVFRSVGIQALPDFCLKKYAVYVRHPDGSLYGVRRGIPFYAVCIYSTRSCACPIVYSCLLPCLILYIRAQAPIHLAWSVAVIIVLCVTCFHTIQESYFITVSCLPVSWAVSAVPLLFRFP